MDKKIKKLGTANPSYTDLNDISDEKLHELREKQIKNLSLKENKLALKSGDKIEGKNKEFWEQFDKFEMRKWLEDISMLLEGQHYRNVNQNHKEGFIKWLEDGGNGNDFDNQELIEMWCDFCYEYINYLVRNKIKEYK